MNLSSTFDVLVGQGPSQQTFTVYTHVLAESSEFMRAARSAQWLVDPKKPVDLTDEDPEVFSAYLNIVYRGAETIREDHEDLMHDDLKALSALTLTEVEEPNDPESQAPTQDATEEEESDDDEEEIPEDAFDMSLEECNKRAAERDNEFTTPYSVVCDVYYTTLARVHILADMLGDLATTNSVMDEFIKSTHEVVYNPGEKVINSIYESTVHGNPLRRLMRDIWVYDTSKDSYLDNHAVALHEDFIRDIMMESLRTRFASEAPEGCEHNSVVLQKTCADPYHYHIHSITLNPRCVPRAIASATPCARAKQS
jgi:hypothetical protein